MTTIIETNCPWHVFMNRKVEKLVFCDSREVKKKQVGILVNMHVTGFLGFTGLDGIVFITFAPPQVKTEIRSFSFSSGYLSTPQDAYGSLIFVKSKLKCSVCGASVLHAKEELQGHQKVI